MYLSGSMKLWIRTLLKSINSDSDRGSEGSCDAVDGGFAVDPSCMRYPVWYTRSRMTDGVIGWQMR
jgi:hypothetical protein